MTALMDLLKNVPLFAGLPESDLRAICESAESKSLAVGEQLFDEGDEGHEAYVIVSGEAQIVKRSGGRDVVLNVVGAGQVIGEMALVESITRTAAVRAATPLELMVVRKDVLDWLLNTSLPAARAIFETVLERWRSTQATLQQGQKMAQLGSMTAGVADELNEPTDIVTTGAAHIADAVAKFVEARAAVAERADGDLDRAIADLINGGENRGAPTAAGEVGDEANETIAAAAEVGRLLDDITDGAERISNMVRALKEYSYLDQAPVQETDVNDGIENTLEVMRSRLPDGITIQRDYGKLPKITAHGSELNQVWTNIIDNAVDALDGKGTITIRTRAEDKHVVVEIEDDGPGVPAGIQGRVFEPFFTTKPPGQGVGLGLDIARSIAAFRHHGSITLSSVPGKTIFTVRLPLETD